MVSQILINESLILLVVELSLQGCICAVIQTIYLIVIVIVQVISARFDVICDVFEHFLIVIFLLCFIVIKPILGVLDS